MEPKSPLASKTVWTNVVILAGWLALRFGWIPAELDPEVVDQAAVALATVGNLVLRFMTERPLGRRDDGPL